MYTDEQFTKSSQLRDVIVAQIVFTTHLQRQIECPPRDVSGATLRESLEEVFADNPKLRSYILDDQQGVRKHVMIFLDGEPINDRIHLSDPVSETSEIYVMQALSGG
jgi:molybdopterin synthase sulfur carrier subunit